MVDTSDVMERRADPVQILEQAKLSKSSHADWQKDEVGASIYYGAFAKFEQGERYTSAGEGVGGCEAYGTTAHHDDSEGVECCHANDIFVRSLLLYVV